MNEIFPGREGRGEWRKRHPKKREWYVQGRVVCYHLAYSSPHTTSCHRCEEVDVGALKIAVGPKY